MMDVINEFDPWDSDMCTCPEKYSLNPYTGCGHRCIYCYSTYIPNFFQPRRKKDLVSRVERDLQKIPKGSLISLSNSSDPYLPSDKGYEDTRRVLKVLRKEEMKVLVVTKGVHLKRDIDILKRMDSAVTISICTLREEIKKRLEPDAPTSQKRLDLVETLTEEGIPVGIRFDPIFPELTEDEIPRIVEKASEVGAEHIVSSTFKARGDSWKRFQLLFPKWSQDLEELYFERGEKIDNSYYLPMNKRMKILKKVEEASEEYDIPFATCREDLPSLNSSNSCDGSHLVR